MTQMTIAVEDSLGNRTNIGLIVTNAIIEQLLLLLADSCPLPNAGNLEAASKTLIEFPIDRAITIDDSPLK
jgi:hypothetical protein